jgi:hypothetical protein
MNLRENQKILRMKHLQHEFQEEGQDRVLFGVAAATGRRRGAVLGGVRGDGERERRRPKPCQRCKHEGRE